MKNDLAPLILTLTLFIIAMCGIVAVSIATGDPVEKAQTETVVCRSGLNACTVIN